MAGIPSTPKKNFQLCQLQAKSVQGKNYFNLTNTPRYKKTNTKFISMIMVVDI